MRLSISKGRIWLSILAGPYLAGPYPPYKSALKERVQLNLSLILLFKLRGLKPRPTIDWIFYDQKGEEVREIIKEIDALTDLLQGCSEESFSLTLIQPLCFAADLNCKETAEIVAKFKRQRVEISNLYVNRDFLQLTLEQWSSRKFFLN